VAEHSINKISNSLDHISFVSTPLPLLVVLAFITGVMSILMGLIAEIIMRTYYESQGKQVYLVKDTMNVVGKS